MIPVRRKWPCRFPRAGVFFAMRTLVIFDGQNLFRSAKDAWGSYSPYSWPSYDVEKLAQHLVSLKPGRILEHIWFYTGVYSEAQDYEKHWFWTNKLDYLVNRGIYVYRGRVRGGVGETKQEKGVDVSIAIDLVQATHDKQYDVAIIVSQDSDYGPAVKLAKLIAKGQGRQLVFESAFPIGPGKRYNRAVPGTDKLEIYKSDYDTCRDWNEYRPPKR